VSSAGTELLRPNEFASRIAFLFPQIARIYFADDAEQLNNLTTKQPNNFACYPLLLKKYSKCVLGPELIFTNW
jgi:hypothetical protein